MSGAIAGIAIKGMTMWPVVEVFGPTIQGEGPMAGRATHFIRFGGCDYRCSWCDSLYAVEPKQWKNAPRMDALDLVSALSQLDEGPEWVTLTGGNPAMYDLQPLVDRLHNAGYKIAVETQGSKWRSWLSLVDCLTISPKPPSSGMVTEKHAKEYERFLERCVRVSLRSHVPHTAIKVVVFDEADYEWAAARFAEDNRGWAHYLSVGTEQGLVDEQTIELILARYHWLCELAKGDPRMARVAALPQLHVLAWGTQRGV